MTPLAFKPFESNENSLGTPHRIINLAHLLTMIKSYIVIIINKRIKTIEELQKITLHLRNVE